MHLATILSTILRVHVVQVVRRMQGYDRGSLGPSSCSSFGGSNLRGRLGSTIAMKDCAVVVNWSSLGHVGCRHLANVSFRIVGAAGANGPRLVKVV